MEIHIQKATRLARTNSKYFNLLADSLVYQKKYDSAAEYLLHALEHDPDNEYYKAKLARIRSYNN